MSDIPATRKTRSSIPVVLRIILATFCILMAIGGLGAIVVIFASFAENGFEFSGSEAVWMQIGLGAGAINVLLPAIVLGIILRYARWKASPTASLVLALIVCGAGVLAAGMLQTTVVEGDTEGAMLLRFFSVVGVAIGAGPPFMHWWKARPDPTGPTI